MKKQLIKTGCFFYGMGIAAAGIHQLLIRDFRPEILPPFPEWDHTYIVFPLLAGIALLVAGILIAGVFTVQ